MPSILIIDDDEAVRSATKYLLEAHGFDVLAAADGTSGVAATKERQFDLVIVDLFMSGMNGLETTRAIRELRPHMPIIAASGFMFGGSSPQMPDFEAMAAEAGATATLYKPFRPTDFLQTIRKAMSAVA